MAVIGGPDPIVQDGLVLHLDAANLDSYPRSGTTWNDLSGNGFNFTIDGSGFTYNTDGWFDMANGGITNADNITDATTCTFVFWIRTTDEQACFWQKIGTTPYLGAYQAGNKFYNSGFGSPTLFMNVVSKANLYDFIRTGEWIMVEFKSVDMSNIDYNQFNQYSSFTFGNGGISIIKIYNRNLTTEESLQNYNSLKDRFE